MVRRILACDMRLAYTSAWLPPELLTCQSSQEFRVLRVNMALESGGVKLLDVLLNRIVDCAIVDRSNDHACILVRTADQRYAFPAALLGDALKQR